MNVTLYGITYDKYENEVYIPVMYFDTLKVSTVEQTTEQSSARGGLGNATHIIWDYGKEIKVNLQDAVYTPASQSLMWGGLYGLKPIKIKGVWVPAEYPVDNYGNSIFYEKVVEENLDIETTEGTDWVGFYCPCDGKMKYMTYRSYPINPFEYNIKNGVFPTTVTRNNKDILVNGKNLYIERDNKENGVLSLDSSKYEEADLFLNNFENFENNQFIKRGTGENYNFTQKNYINPKCHSILEYRWNQCTGQMVTTSVNKKQAYCEDIDFCIHSFEDNNNKRFLFKNYNEDLQSLYTPYHHFYQNITKKLKGFEVKKVTIGNNEVLIKIPVEKTVSFKIYLGTFFIIEDWNISNSLEEPGLNLIDSKIKTNSLLNRVRSYSVKKPFAINVDSNIFAYNAMKDAKYSNSNLTVYIDPNTLMPYEPNAHEFTKINGETIIGNFKIFKPGEYYYSFKRSRSDESNNIRQIVVRAQDYPGVFKMVGETYARNRYGEDVHYQIEIPNCKLNNNVSLDLSADGGPTTVDLNFTVLVQPDGTLIKLTRYEEDDCECVENFEEKYGIEILAPAPNEIYCVGQDCRINEYDETTGDYTYLRLPSDDVEAAEAIDYFNNNTYEDYIKKYRQLLLIQVLNSRGQAVQILTQDNCSDFDIAITVGSEEV